MGQTFPEGPITSLKRRITEVKYFLQVIMDNSFVYKCASVNFYPVVPWNSYQNLVQSDFSKHPFTSIDIHMVLLSFLVLELSLMPCPSFYVKEQQFKTLEMMTISGRVLEYVTTKEIHRPFTMKSAWSLESSSPMAYMTRPNPLSLGEYCLHVDRSASETYSNLRKLMSVSVVQLQYHENEHKIGPVNIW